MNWTRVVLLITAATIAALAGADGGFISRMSREAKPTIPYQRAFVSWRNGRETMIVESVLNAPQGEYAWIVPLPSKPAAVRACTPGTLESLTLLATPVPDRGPREGKGLVLWALFMVCVAALYPIIRREIAPAHQRLSFLTACLAAVVLCVCPCAFFFPVYAGPSPTPRERSVFVAESGTAGVYAYDVVSSSSAANLTDWLTRNGYILPQKAAEAVKRYVEKKWCFVAMKLRHGATGKAAPHPVLFEFAASDPVYPMALTGATTDRLRLDLFVAAEGRAKVAGMPVWRTSAVKRLEAFDLTPTEPSRTRRRPDFTPISHPQIAPYFWDGATLTYLRGDLAARDMKCDFAISVKPGPPENWSKAIFSTDDVTDWSVTIGAALAALTMGVATFIAMRKPFDYRRLAKTASLAAAVGLVAGFVAYPFFPSVAVAEGEPRIALTSRVHELKHALDDLNSHLPWDPTKFPDSWLATLKEHHLKPTELDVPGGYTLRKTKTGYEVTLYDLRAAAITYAVDNTGKIERLTQ